MLAGMKTGWDGTGWSVDRDQLCGRAERLCHSGDVGIAGPCGRFEPSAGPASGWELVGDRGFRPIVCHRILRGQDSCVRSSLNALHTFVRVPVAALIAYGATVAALAGEAVAGLRWWAGDRPGCARREDRRAAAVTPSPEPVSNISLSVGRMCWRLF